MREIKFRAFETTQKRMWNWEELKDFFYLDKIIESKEFIVMEYTGLKDNHDREIYEGDVLSSQGDIGVVVFENGCFCLKFNDGEVMPLSKLQVWVYYCKAGNIYENPELLKGDKNES